MNSVYILLLAAFSGFSSAKTEIKKRNWRETGVFVVEVKKTFLKNDTLVKNLLGELNFALTSTQDLSGDATGRKKSKFDKLSGRELTSYPQLQLVYSFLRESEQKVRETLDEAWESIRKENPAGAERIERKLTCDKNSCRVTIDAFITYGIYATQKPSRPSTKTAASNTNPPTSKSTSTKVAKHEDVREAELRGIRMFFELSYKKEIQYFFVKSNQTSSIVWQCSAEMDNRIKKPLPKDDRMLSIGIQIAEKKNQPTTMALSVARKTCKNDHSEPDPDKAKKCTMVIYGFPHDITVERTPSGTYLSVVMENTTRSSNPLYTPSSNRPEPGPRPSGGPVKKYLIFLPMDMLDNPMPHKAVVVTEQVNATMATCVCAQEFHAQKKKATPQIRTSTPTSKIPTKQRTTPISKGLPTGQIMKPALDASLVKRAKEEAKKLTRKPVYINIIQNLILLVKQRAIKGAKNNNYLMENEKKPGEANGKEVKMATINQASSPEGIVLFKPSKAAQQPDATQVAMQAKNVAKNVLRQTLYLDEDNKLIFKPKKRPIKQYNR
ncbi:uncharacterized protein LOC116616121 [Nematostella vectensis]|uniref:uncharacterized protein LOC116616121 n=1 Tax=Nematostella vectensis TaxID=45351 RepID=UPI00138FF322|nr:uncharacterized protein LOC116616121 [Nematostella vectensis]